MPASVQGTHYSKQGFNHNGRGRDKYIYFIHTVLECEDPVFHIWKRIMGMLLWGGRDKSQL